MSLMRRLGYYLGGFSIGLILLAFFLSGKRTSCDYGPEARGLKNIRTKTPSYQAALLDAISSGTIDSSTVRDALLHGNVNFKASDARRDSCGLYVIEYREKQRVFTFNVENCETVARIDLMPEKD